MTEQEAKQIIHNFSQWNIDDQWIDNEEMQELVEVLDNTLENIIEIKNHIIRLRKLYEVRG